MRVRVTAKTAPHHGRWSGSNRTSERVKFASAVVLSLLLTQSAVAATRHWTGAKSDLWSDSLNWSDGAPVAGDDLVFPAGSNGQTTNDYPNGTYFHSITFSGTSALFSLGGNTISLGPGGWTQSDDITVFARVSLSLAASQTWHLGTIGVFGGLAFGGSSDVVQLDLGANTLTVIGGETKLSPIVVGTGNIQVLDGGLRISDGSQVSAAGPITIGANGALLLRTTSSDLVATPIIVKDGGFMRADNRSVLSAPLTLEPGSRFMEYFNPAPSPGEYFLTVETGVITLGGALDMSGTLPLAPLGTIYTVIHNETGKPVVGTFAGLPEGQTLTPYAGSNTYRISYVGGSGHDVTLTVVAPPTVTTLASSHASSTSGESVTFTATVSPAATGSVTFFDCAVPVATVPLDSSSRASLTTGSLSCGSHNITAQYLGSDSLAPSTSSIVVQQVLINTAIPALDPKVLALLGTLLIAIAVTHMRR